MHPADAPKYGVDTKAVTKKYTINLGTMQGLVVSLRDKIRNEEIRIMKGPLPLRCNTTNCWAEVAMGGARCQTKNEQMGINAFTTLELVLFFLLHRLPLKVNDPTDNNDSLHSCSEDVGWFFTEALS